MALYHTRISTHFGDWSVSDDGQHVVALDYWPEPTITYSETELGLNAKEQVLRYIADASFQFDLPLKPVGTDFQQKVWRMMCQIPAGETLTYGDVANSLNSAARAVGGACRANPIPLIIPCHRIVGKQGLGGFSGQTKGLTIDLKKLLLRHEGAL